MNDGYINKVTNSLVKINNESEKKIRLKKINRTRYFDQVVDQIRTLIDSGIVNVGDKLPTINELSDQLSIGRSSIREALRILETEGLIEVHQGSGTFVRPRSDWLMNRNNAIGWIKQRGESIIQLLQVREWLEGLSISLVAQNPSPEAINELESILDEIAFLVKEADTKDIEPDLDKISKLNTSFHLAISKHSGNQIVYKFLSEILPSFSESNMAVLFTKPSLDQQAIEHQNILSAIKNRDPDRAVHLIRNHVIRVKEDIQGISEEEYI